MARRSDHNKDELSALILEHATKIAEKDGFSALTARKLAKSIGYTPGTIYNFYGSMDGVYLAVNVETLEKLRAQLAESIEQATTRGLAERLQALADSYQSFITENTHLWLMLFEHKLKEDTPTPEWLNEKVDALFALIEDIIRESAPNLNEKAYHLSARTLWSAVHGIYFLEKTDKLAIGESVFTPQEMTAFLIRNHVKSLTS